MEYDMIDEYNDTDSAVYLIIMFILKIIVVRLFLVENNLDLSIQICYLKDWDSHDM